MNIPPELYDHPVVRECMNDASRRIEGWPVTHHPDCVQAKELLTTGWDGVCLLKMLTSPLLELRGITPEDIDIFEMMIVERRVNDTNRGALYEEWDAERAKARKFEGT